MSNLTTRATKGDSLTHGELDTNFKRGAQTKAASYTVVEGDNRDAIDVTAVATITLPDATAIVAAADTGDFEVTLNNTTVAVMTITCVTGTDTIDGSTSDYIVNGIDSITLKVDQAGTGYNIVGGAATKTATETFTNKTLTEPLINGQAGYGLVVLDDPVALLNSSSTTASVAWETLDVDSIHAQAGTDDAKIALIQCGVNAGALIASAPSQVFCALHARSKASAATVGVATQKCKAQVNADVNDTSPISLINEDVGYFIVNLDSNYQFEYWRAISVSADSALVFMTLVGYYV